MEAFLVLDVDRTRMLKDPRALSAACNYLESGRLTVTLPGRAAAELEVVAWRVTQREWPEPSVL
jgi:hypothetical protein